MKANDPELKAELERLHESSWAWALTCCRQDKEHAQEALSGAYLKVLEGRAKYEARSALKTWFFSVIRFTAIEQRRSGARRLELLKRWFEANDEGAQPCWPDERASVMQQRAQVKEALSTLSKRQREVLELVFYHDMTLEEAAQVLALPVGTVRTHYARGKKQMLARLSPALDVTIEVS